MSSVRLDERSRKECILNLVTIPFQERWQGPMLNLGNPEAALTKSCTSRTEKYGDVGDRFRAFDRAFEFTEIRQCELSYVASDLWKEEGCENSDDFRAAWVGLHRRRGFVPDQVVYVHFFKPVVPVILELTEYTNLHELIIKRNEEHGDADLVLIAALLADRQGPVARGYVMEKLAALNAPYPENLLDIPGVQRMTCALEEHSNAPIRWLATSSGNRFT